MATFEVFNCKHPKFSWNIIWNSNGKRQIVRCRYCHYVNTMKRHRAPVIKTFEQYTAMRIRKMQRRDAV